MGIDDYYSSINGGAGNDSMWVNGNDVTIEGGDGNDTIEHEGENVIIRGGKGNDFIKGTALWSSSTGELLLKALDKVTYQYASGDGNDTIDGFNEKNVIQISGGTYTTQSSGNDVLIKIGSGSILLKDANGKKLNIQTVQGGSSTDTSPADTTPSAATTLTVTNATKSPITIGSAIKTVNAASRTTAVKITGNDLANSISGGSGNDSLYGAAGNDSILGNAGNDKLYGQDGNDVLSGGAGNNSLAGGAGNDSFAGDAGNDTFFYAEGGGKDVIFGFENNDLLQITGTFSASYNSSKKEIAFKVGTTSNAIILK